MELAGVARRIPFSFAVCLTIVALGVVTGGLWSPLEARGWLDDVAYGPKALEEHRWWTLFTGPFLVLSPWQYPVVVGFFLLMSGLCEWHLGSRITAWCVVIGQLAGTVLGGLLVLALAQLDWEWARRIADELDLGFSGGAMCAAAVASAAFRRPWRARVRFVLLGYTLTSLTFLGFLYDVEHLVAVLLGLWIGPWVVGRRPASLRRMARDLLSPSLTRRDLRLAAAAFFWLSAVLTLLGQVVDREGPFGAIGGDPKSWWWVALVVAADLFVANGLVRGRRSWWRLAVAVTFASWVATLLTGGFIMVGAAVNSGLLWLVVILDTVGLGVLVWGRHAFRNPGRRGLRKAGAESIGALPTEGDRARARTMLTTRGSPNRLSWMTTWPQNRWWFARDDGAVAYRLSAGVAIGLCDPITETATPRAVADQFVAAAHDAGTVPCLFSSGRGLAEWAHERGWLAVQVAEEAIVDLVDLEFRGKKWQDVRSAFNQAEKNGVTVRFYRLAQAPRSVRVQVAAICDEWVHEKRVPEMGFTLGGLEEAMDPEVWVAVAIDAEMTVHGVTSWMPIHVAGGDIEGWTLDLMRRLPGGFRYTMELLIASACLHFREQGHHIVSLSGAPLARVAPDETAARGVVDDMLSRLGTLLEPFYGFRSLQAFKAKFQPRYEPLYLLVSDEAVLPRVGLAIARSYLADATLGQLLVLGRSG